MDVYQTLYAGKRVCCTCGHYCQHYRKGKRKYFPVGWGHCVEPRIKPRRPEQTCEHWTARKEEPVSFH